MPSGASSVGSTSLDHVMVMVRDLQVASANFGRLGFRVIPGGVLPGGLENTLIPFGVGKPYVELVGIRSPGGAQIRDNEEFLARGEGAIYAGLRVASADSVAKRLREIGIAVPDPFTGTIKVEGVTETPPALWKDVIVPHGSSPRADPLFFVESLGDYRALLAAQDPELLRRYDEQRSLPHPNGATALSSVWLAVEDLDLAVRRYEHLGFERVREFRVEPLEARAIEVALARGSLLLLESESPRGPIRRLLDLRQFGTELPGISVEVPNLEQALASIAPEIRAGIRPDQGASGRHVMIPADSAHGLWMELFERTSAPN